MRLRKLMTCCWRENHHVIPLRISAAQRNGAIAAIGVTGKKFCGFLRAENHYPHDFQPVYNCEVVVALNFMPAAVSRLPMAVSITAKIFVRSTLLLRSRVAVIETPFALSAELNALCASVAVKN